MKRCIILVAAVTLFATGLSTVNAAIIVSDNFESYADTAAMDAVWGAANNGTLDPATGNPGQSMAHPGLTSGVRSMTPTTATDANPLLWQFDFLDDGLGNKRLSGALRDVGGSAPGNQAFFEMGRFNSVNNPETGTTVSGYAFRHVFVGGAPAGASGWLTYVGNPLVRVGWHRFSASIGQTTATFNLDFSADGTIDASRTISLGGVAKQYNLVRFGGPSDVSSAGGGGHFDNLIIQNNSAPTVVDAVVGPPYNANEPGDPQTLTHQFTATDVETPAGPFTWDMLSLVSYTPNYGGSGAGPLIAATLSGSGQFDWVSEGSPRGDYIWKVRARDPGGLSDEGTITVHVTEVPEPASLVLSGLAMVGIVGIARRRNG